MTRLLCVLSAALLAVIAAASAASAADNGGMSDLAQSDTWHPAGGVTILAAEFEGESAIKIEGIQEGGWNYLESAPFKTKPGGKYRLSGSVFVAAVEPGLPPYLNVEFVRLKDGQWDTGVSFGQVTTARYDTAKGGWQRLSAEFEAPGGTDGAYVMLDKGTQAAVRLTAYLAEVEVEEMDEFSGVEEYGFESPPQPLDRMKNIHPRLHLTAERVSELAELVKTDKRYAAMWEEVKAIADRGVESGPPEYQLDDRWSGTEQLWQRSVGEMIPHIAMAYLMTGERKYLDSARDWMIASCGYETWGLPPFRDVDLAAGHQLYGLALAYDWLYHDLDEETKQTVRECFRQRADYMFRQAAIRQAWWHNSYLQNHLWVSVTGLAAAGFAVYGEVEGAGRWIALPLADYRVTFDALGEDGASHEGVSYWTYGLEYMLKFMDLAQGLLGEDFFADSRWFAETPYFRLYASLPKDFWSRRSNVMSWADSVRWDWYGPEYMLRKLASEYRDGHSQWLADALDDANVCGRTATFLNLIWYDPAVEPLPPDDLPTMRHFDDMDIVCGRSDWSGRESVWSFKCGPHIGHKALEVFDFDPGSGHVHPDAGAFQIFSDGDWLITDDGYTWKTTEFQNTVLASGVGQEGEGRAWFDGGTLYREKRGARILAAVSGERMDYVIGDVTDAYKREAGLERFIREFYFVKPSTWIVVDRIEAAEPSTFELLFHSDFPFEKVADAPVGAWQVKGERGALRVFPLMPVLPTGEARVEEAFKQDLQETGGAVGRKTLEALRISNAEKKTSEVFVTVMSACPADAEPPLAFVTTSYAFTTVHVNTAGGTRAFTLDLSAPAGTPSLTEGLPGNAP